jgi:PTH2 family peptidyl-tRNA hydrolase
MKQAIVVNGALNLPPGKLAAQVAHAAVAGFLAASPEARTRWLECGMPKVVLRAESAEELKLLEASAASTGIPTELITDAGRTVVAPGTVTCLALGPADGESLDRITGTLRLL